MKAFGKPLVVLTFLVISAGAAFAQTVPDWQKKWDATLAAAKAEGKVVVVGQP